VFWILYCLDTVMSISEVGHKRQSVLAGLRHVTYARASRLISVPWNVREQLWVTPRGEPTVSCYLSLYPTSVPPQKILILHLLKQCCCMKNRLSLILLSVSFQFEPQAALRLLQLYFCQLKLPWMVSSCGCLCPYQCLIWTSLWTSIKRLFKQSVHFPLKPTGYCM